MRNRSFSLIFFVYFSKDAFYLFTKAILASKHLLRIYILPFRLYSLEVILYIGLYLSSYLPLYVYTSRKNLFLFVRYLIILVVESNICKKGAEFVLTPFVLF